MSFYCDICFKSFSTIQAFKSHERSNNHSLKILQKIKKNHQQNKTISEDTIYKDIIKKNKFKNKKNEINDTEDLLDFLENSSLEDLMDIDKEIFQEVNKNHFFKEK